MERLFEGRTPLSETLDTAPLLSQWHVKRSNGGLYLTGTVRIRHVNTDTLCFMDAAFRWCRCESGWWRLGDPAGFDDDIPVELEL